MALEEYLSELSDPSQPLKVADLAQLSALTTEAAPTVANAWPQIFLDRRKTIVSDLTQLAEDNIEYDFDTVLFIALDDSEDSVRVEAVRGLWENDSPEFMARLLDMVTTDDNARVRAETALALGRFALNAAFGKLPQRQVERLEETLRTVVSDPREVTEVRGRALEALSPLNQPWVQGAINEAYHDGDMRLRIAAVHAMGRSCDPTWLPTLYGELENEDPELRYEAATACGVLGDDDAVSHLLRLVLDEDEEVREAAIAALGEIGGDKARDTLMILLDSESEATREAASAALATIDFEEDPLAVRFRD